MYSCNDVAVTNCRDVRKITVKIHIITTGFLMVKLLQPEKQQKYCNVVKFELKC